MHMSGRVSCYILFAGLASLSADSVQRPDLSGLWRLEPSRSEIHSRISPQLTLQIEQKADTIHLVKQTGEKGKPDDFKCAMDGKDCKVKEEGHAATVSFYYNGPVLVEIKSEGQNHDVVTKSRLQLSPDGSTLTVDVIHVMPEGRQPEKLVLTRQAGDSH
jgi:hypothetical protein